MPSNTSSPLPGATSSQPTSNGAAPGVRKPMVLTQLQKNAEKDGSAPTSGTGSRSAQAGETERASPRPDRQPEGDLPTRPALEIDDDDDAGEPRQSREQEQRRTLQQIADETGISVKQLYKALVDTGIDGEEPVSLGTLKDKYRESRDLAVRQDEFEHDRDTFQTEILQSREQVQAVVDRLVSVVGQETFERVLGDVHQQTALRLQNARAQLLEWYPQWNDPMVMQKDRARIEEVLGTYGIPKQRVASIQDPVIVKFVLDSIKLRDRYERLKAGTVEKKPTTAPASRKSHRPSTFEEAKAVAERTGDPKAGIAKLLGG